MDDDGRLEQRIVLNSLDVDCRGRTVIGATQFNFEVSHACFPAYKCPNVGGQNIFKAEFTQGTFSSEFSIFFTDSLCV